MHRERGPGLMDLEDLRFTGYEFAELIVVPFIGCRDLPVPAIPILPVHDIDIIGMLARPDIVEHITPHSTKIRASAPRTCALGHASSPARIRFLASTGNQFAAGLVSSRSPT